MPVLMKSFGSGFRGRCVYSQEALVLYFLYFTVAKVSRRIPKISSYGPYPITISMESLKIPGQNPIFWLLGAGLDVVGFDL